MSLVLGIRREDKNKWERRVPIIPEHIKELKEKYGINTIIQPSQIRAFSDKQYKEAGATVNEEISASVILAIKEIPISYFEPDKTYVFFSHTIKGQEHNIPMLRKMMELKCNLIDYEKITNEKGRRLIFFGRYAGVAGMIDSLWAFGQRLKWKGIKSSISEIKQTIDYQDLDHAKEHLAKIGDKIKKESFNKSISAEDGIYYPGQDAIRFYTDFSNPSKRVYTWNRQLHYSVDACVEGKNAIIFDYAYNVPLIRERAPYLSFDIASMPQIKGREFDVNYANY